MRQGFSSSALNPTLASEHDHDVATLAVQLVTKPAATLYHLLNPASGGTLLKQSQRHNIISRRFAPVLAIITRQGLETLI